MTSPARPDGTASEKTVRDLFVRELANILGIEPSAVDPAKNLDDLGLDSTDTIIVVGIIEEQLGIELAPELLLQHRTIDDVIQALKEIGVIV